MNQDVSWVSRTISWISFRISFGRKKHSRFDFRNPKPPRSNRIRNATWKTGHWKKKKRWDNETTLQQELLGCSVKNTPLHPLWHLRHRSPNWATTHMFFSKSAWKGCNSYTHTGHLQNHHRQPVKIPVGQWYIMIYILTSQQVFDSGLSPFPRFSWQTKVEITQRYSWISNQHTLPNHWILRLTLGLHKLCHACRRLGSGRRKLGWKTCSGLQMATFSLSRSVDTRWAPTNQLCRLKQLHLQGLQNPRAY